MPIAITLDQLSLRQCADIVGVDWAGMSDAEGRRLRALGIDEGVRVEKLYKGMLGLSDPIALKVGRMTVALRRSHAQAISVEIVPVTIAA